MFTKKGLFLLLSIVLAVAVQGFVSKPSTSVKYHTQLSESTATDATQDAVTHYVQCGRCQSAFAVQEEDFKGRGRRLECGVCQHSWVQSKDRLMTLNNGFEMVPLPQRDLDRIETNIKEGKSPKFTGVMKLYVGNIAFGSTEDELVELFSEVGNVGDIAVVRDDQGRNRGFGFVTMRTKEDGEAAIEKLDGTEFNGRNIAVRESTN